MVNYIYIDYNDIEIRYVRVLHEYLIAIHLPCLYIALIATRLGLSQTKLGSQGRLHEYITQIFKSVLGVASPTI
jgi:hypothetical protein